MGPGGGRGPPGLPRVPASPRTAELLVALVLLAFGLAAMEGPRELLSGKFQLCFTPAAGTSLLMLRLNDAALRALQECRRQQVRPTRIPIFPSPYPSGSRASASDPGEGTWAWEAASAGSDLATSPSEASKAGPPGTRRRILGMPLHLRSVRICSPRRFGQ